ncbi:FHF complex subunit HOOK interacting protein 2A-like isoform X2 [Leptopilina boulardi]|uniref:FHF complex subunit HOOK interacting protein 2A-like isoform X2 n=1 Tax=Leptopilina boulardi TaxID=63433 RepID=UPI0021F54CFF|nr:FHF complex subunit HOOK interacting protein 2A-like isoform X2 [Leptopilina boulardi]
MLRRLRKFKRIAPPATPFQDFTYHWKQLMNFYADHLTDTKVPIESTGIPHHLNRLLEILILEEKDREEPGSCLEYLIQHKLLDLLATLACAESPPGMRLVSLAFFRKLLTRSKFPLLHHSAVFIPIQRLIEICDGNRASPIENEEIQFLLALCFLVCKYPHCTNIVNESRNIHRESNATHNNDTDRNKIQNITYVADRRCSKSNPLFKPLNTQAITLVNPDLFAGGDGGGGARLICSKRISRNLENSVEKNSQITLEQRDIRNDTENVPSCSNISSQLNEFSNENASQSSSPTSQKCSFEGTSTMENPCDNQDNENSSNVPDETCDIVDTIINDIENVKVQFDSRKNNSCEENTNIDSPLSDLEDPPSSKCLMIDALKSYINSADNTVRIRACEGIMVLASLEDTSFITSIAQSDLPLILSKRLEILFNAIPAHVFPNEIDDIEVTWGLDSPLLTSEKKFPGCRRVAAFFMWLDFCDQLIKEAHQKIAEIVAKTIRIEFFETILTPALSEHHVVLVTSLITKCFKEITSHYLSREMSFWLVGQHRNPDIPNFWSWPVLHRLIDNCCTDSDDLTVETLKLFEEMIEKRNEHILHCLVLTYLTNRGYYDNSAADSAIASWSDEEDEREREKKSSLDLSSGINHSRTLAPSNIHRILNCFLSLIPRQLQTDFEANRYERYMLDWEKQYSIVFADCALFAWPLEAVTVDDSASSDSRPEADHGSTRFYMGPFLSMLLEKINNLANQKHDINLQLTIVISKLALLPHPYLHEFLLNPLIPLTAGNRSLFICLQRVVKHLMSEVQKTPNYKQLLKETRHRLLEDSCIDPAIENILFESVIITEEFCKELAAIAYVKYHHSMPIKC